MTNNSNSNRKKNSKKSSNTQTPGPQQPQTPGPQQPQYSGSHQQHSALTQSTTSNTPNNNNSINNNNSNNNSNNSSNNNNNSNNNNKKKKMLEFCGNNPKTCIGGVAALGFAAYVGKKYKDLKDDEKTCLKRCYPTNWEDYVEDVDTEPLYKSTKDPLQFSELELLADDEVKEELEKELCNKDNLDKKNIPEGKTSCDKFCKDACKATFKKALDGAAGDLGGGAGDLSKGLFDSIKKVFKEFLKGLGIDPKMLLFGFIGFIVFIIFINVL